MQDNNMLGFVGALGTERKDYCKYQSIDGHTRPEIYSCIGYWWSEQHHQNPQTRGRRERRPNYRRRKYVRWEERKIELDMSNAVAIAELYKRMEPEVRVRAENDADFVQARRDDNALRN
eukprot:scaffold167_cov168-Ochromonas_danica.AAC.12